MERDFVVRKLTVSFEGVFSIPELLRHLKSWFKEYKYALFEDSVKERPQNDGRALQLKWTGKKEYTDYIMYIIEGDLLFTHLQDVEGKGKKLVKGDATLSFTGYLLKDYEETWVKKGISKFLREVYDKFANKDEINACAEELNTEVRRLVQECKSFLNIKKE